MRAINSCSLSVKGSKIIIKATIKLGTKLKIILKKFESNVSILFSIISNSNIRGKKNMIGSQIKVAKNKKIANENILKLLYLGTNK